MFSITIDGRLNIADDIRVNRKIFVMPERRATMTNNWENQFVNVKLAGKVMVVIVNQRQSVVAMINVAITLSVSMERVHASKDSRETFQTCKRFHKFNINVNELLYGSHCQLCSWIVRRSNLR